MASLRCESVALITHTHTHKDTMTVQRNSQRLVLVMYKEYVNKHSPNGIW